MSGDKCTSMGRFEHIWSGLGRHRVLPASVVTNSAGKCADVSLKSPVSSHSNQVGSYTSDLSVLSHLKQTDVNVSTVRRNVKM